MSPRVRRGDAGADLAAQRKRSRETLLGIGILLLGVVVFLRQPEHGQMVALALVGFGGAMIDRRLAGAWLRRGSGIGDSGE